MAVKSSSFYNEYHGHRVEHLEVGFDHLSKAHDQLIWLVGDSTLDNKYWLPSKTQPAINGYEAFLRPPRSKPDVAYHINCEMAARSKRAAAINAAVEEATLIERSGSSMLPQDEFVRDHLGPDDVLVVSCGGNDIALRPTLPTVLSMISLLLTPKWMIEHSPWVPGMSHFIHLFKTETSAFVEKLTARCKPRCVVLCMLYYLDEASPAGGSWADRTLSILRYNQDPSKLQLVTRRIFECATSQARPDGVSNVIALPWYSVLDGKDTADYVQRVEPSSRGGEKMASLLCTALEAKGIL